VLLDGKVLELEPGQQVSPHGVDRGLDVDEIAPPGGPDSSS
jgi:hypothetical protein